MGSIFTYFPRLPCLTPTLTLHLETRLGTCLSHRIIRLDLEPISRHTRLDLAELRFMTIPVLSIGLAGTFRPSKIHAVLNHGRCG